jgi:hypothetical protein
MNQTVSRDEELPYVEVLNRVQQIRRPEACMVLSFYQEGHQPESEL